MIQTINTIVIVLIQAAAGICLGMWIAQKIWDRFYD